MKNVKDKASILAIIIGVFILIFAGNLFLMSTEETVTVTVIDKERITTGSGESISSKYLVFTQGETFENTDTMLYYKFNSSDIQGSLQPGNRYNIRVYGWRVPFMSMYRNILSARRVN